MSEIRIGISGWTYPPWRGVFYPEKWRQKDELAYASRQVSSIEINGTFYSLQRPESYRKWFEETPDDFVFAVKGGRFITHIRRLKDIEQAVANFLASGLLRLEKKLGPILWQLPPSLKFDPVRLETFFKLLPHTMKDAVAVAKTHNEIVEDHDWTELDPELEECPVRHALEVRHPSFQCEEFIELLRQYRVALVVADTAGKWPFMEDITSDFVYVRLHGEEELYASGYTEESLANWAHKIESWSKGKNPEGAKLFSSKAPKQKQGCDVYVYFDNDVKVRAPHDAMSLAHRLGLGDAPTPMLRTERIEEMPRLQWKQPHQWART
ncbi:MAG: DUF72 domain-containing protein [Chthoniobacterales bacterium]